MASVRLYVSPLSDAGVISKDANGDIDGWIEITEDVHMQSLGKIIQRVDKNKFSIGIIPVSSTTFKVFNASGKYSPVGEENSIFRFTRAGTPFKMTFNRADHIPEYNIARYEQSFYFNEVIMFQGFIDDKNSKLNLKDHSINFKALGREGFIKKALTPGTLTATVDTVSVASEIILNQSIITDQLTVAIGNLNPTSNPILDVVSHFDGLVADKTLNELLLVSNSILFIDSSDNVIMRTRTPDGPTDFSFFGPSSEAGNQNLFNIRNINPGLAQIINRARVEGTAVAKEDADSIGVNGYKIKEVSVDSITNAAKQQTVVDNLIAFFANPKQTFSMQTELNYLTLAIPLIGRLAIDSPPLVIEDENTAFYEVSDYDESNYAAALTSFEVLPTVPYSVEGIIIDPKPKNLSIEFEVRRI